MSHKLTTQLPWNEKLKASTKGSIFAILSFIFLYIFSTLQVLQVWLEDVAQKGYLYNTNVSLQKFS